MLGRVTRWRKEVRLITDVMTSFLPNSILPPSSSSSSRMGLSDHIKRAIGSTPERPTGASGGRLSVSSAASSSDGAGEPVKGRERSASSSFSNLLGGGSDKRKSTEVLQDADDSEVLDESEGNVLLSLISQREFTLGYREGEGSKEGGGGRDRSILPPHLGWLR